MNFVAHGLNLEKGDEIINTDQEHGEGYAAWKQLEKRKESFINKQLCLFLLMISKRLLILF